MSIKIDKQNMVYPHNRMLLSNKKNWVHDTEYSLDEPWKHYAKWKKSVTKYHML